MPDDRERAVHALETCVEPLCEAYDLAMLDLDGVVYRGREAVPGATEHLRRAAERGMHLAYVTNNASRRPSAVGEHLRDLGIAAADADVVTSAQAAARLVAAQVPAEARVLVVGGDGLVAALEEHGLRPVSRLDEDPAAVVQGFHPELDWHQLAEGSYAVATGLPWIASNTDLTVPTARGRAPGNGTLVAAVSAATGRTPVVAGKPEPALFDETVTRVGGRHPLVVGDRLDTDIEGANRVGADSLLVLTGVSRLLDAALADPRHRPTFVAPDLGGLSEPQPAVRLRGEGAECAGWTVRLGSGHARLDGPSERPEGEAARIAVCRAVLSAAWRVRDERDASGTDELDLSAVDAIWPS